MVTAVFSALPLLAQTSRVYRDGNGWVEEISGTLPASRGIKVTTDMGSVQVQGGNQNEIHYVIRKHSYTSSEEEARRSFAQFQTAAARKGDVAVLDGNWEGGRARHFGADFVLAVPRNIDFTKLNTEGGSISVRSITGRIDAESGGGSVQMDDIAGPVQAETGGGSIDVGTAHGVLNLHTGGGSIHVGSTEGRLVASSGGGSISVGSAANIE